MPIFRTPAHPNTFVGQKIKSVLCFLLTVFIILLCASKQMPKAWKHFFVWNLDCQEFAIASWHSKFEVEDISAMLSVIMVSKMLSSV